MCEQPAQTSLWTGSVKNLAGYMRMIEIFAFLVAFQCKSGADWFPWNQLHPENTFFFLLIFLQLYRDSRLSQISTFLSVLAWEEWHHLHFRCMSCYYFALHFAISTCNKSKKCRISSQLMERKQEQKQKQTGLHSPDEKSSGVLWKFVT